MGLLKSLPGLYRAKEKVRGIVSSASGVQTVLLYGPFGSGTSELASVLAQAWLCQNPADGEPCGECDACRRFEKGTCPDLMKAVPQPPSNIIRVTVVDGDPDTGSPGIRPFLTFPPTTARNKVVWIEEANRMNAAAANALLKTLEEPPPYGRIVMTAPSPSSVLGTIVSRSLAIACELPSREDFEGQFDDIELFFGENSPIGAGKVQAKKAVYERILGLARDLPSTTPAGALRQSRIFREIAEQFKEGDMTSRQAQADCAEALARALAVEWPGAVPRVIETHRRIVGNGSASMALDSLFAGLAASRQ